MCNGLDWFWVENGSTDVAAAMVVGLEESHHQEFWRVKNEVVLQKTIVTFSFCTTNLYSLQKKVYEKYMNNNNYIYHVL